MSTKTFWLKSVKPTFVENFEHQVLLANIKDNGWHHCAIVYNGDTTYYVDGLIVARNPQNALMSRIEKYKEFNENFTQHEILKDKFDSFKDGNCLNG